MHGPRLQPRHRCPRLLLRCPRSGECLLVLVAGAAAKGGVLRLTMETITRARAPSLSHRLHRMTLCLRPRLSACHQVFSRSLLPDADRSLTGFRPVDCRLLLRVEDAFSGRPLAQPADLLGKQTCYSRLSPSRRSGIGPRVLGTVVPSPSWSCSWC